MYLRIFRPAEYVFGDDFGVPRHDDAQQKILTEIIVCSSVLTIPRVFLPTDYVFGDCFGVSLDVGAQVTILS